jgi:hypothetical protein
MSRHLWALAALGALAGCVTSLPPVGDPPNALPPEPIPPPPSAPPPVASAPPPATSTSLPPRSREEREAAVLGLLSGAVDPSQLPIDAEKRPSGRGATASGVYQNAITNNRDALGASCWRPAQQAARERGQPAPVSLPLRLTLRLLPDGRVEEASATGGGAFPGLADCVLRAVRAMALPPSGVRQQITVDLNLR